MAVVSLQSVVKQFGTKIVLEGVSFDLHSGETAGLIGPNGAGKTTLFRLITGELAPDLGTVTRARDLTIGHLKQEPQIGQDCTLHDEVGSVFADLLVLEHQLHAISDAMAAKHDEESLPELMAKYETINQRFIAAGGYTFETRLNEILGGLGFSEADRLLPMTALSGGQKCRAALAKLLLQDRKLLLLDEPTNHLDLDAVRWLEKFLASHHGGAVIVSHDRYLLDRLVDRIIEVKDRRVTNYPGNYSNYVKASEMAELTRQRQFVKDAEFIRKEKSFIAKHLAGQRTKEAQGRRKRLERKLAGGELVTESAGTSRVARISFQAEREHAGSETVLRCEELKKAYPGKPLFADLSFQVLGGQRFGITGPNGTGKSTLLKIILGECPQDEGTVELDPKYQVGYYDQEHAELDAESSVLDEVLRDQPGLGQQAARSYLARFLFRGDDVFKKLGLLSGGEQSRVRLAKLILSQPDLLILDEPTNHLDIPSREMLETALLDFGGTIILVSHDRYLLDRLVDRLLVIRPEGHALYNGNYSFYLEQLEGAKGRARSGTPSKGRTKKSPAKAGKKRSPYDHHSVEELEEMIIERESQLAEVSERFGDSAVNKNPEALEELQEEADRLANEISELDAAWQERGDDE